MKLTINLTIPDCKDEKDFMYQIGTAFGNIGLTLNNNFNLVTESIKNKKDIEYNINIIDKPNDFFKFG